MTEKKAMVFSFSKLKAAEQCELQWTGRYVDKRYPDREGIEAFVGKCVHEAVEFDHNSSIAGSYLSVTRLGEIYRETFLAKYKDTRHYDVRGHGKDYWYKYGIDCLNNYITMGRIADEDTLLGIEQKLGAMLLPDVPASLIGILDRILMDAAGNVVIDDFKTGRQPDKKFFIKDHQLPLYSYLACRERELPMDKPMLVRRFYLGTGQVESILVSPQRRIKAWEWAENQARRCLELEASYIETQEAEANVTTLCNWCVYKPECSAHQPISLEDVVL